jgi:hypothetical protein
MVLVLLLHENTELMSPWLPWLVVIHSLIMMVHIIGTCRNLMIVALLRLCHDVLHAVIHEFFLSVVLPNEDLAFHIKELVPTRSIINLFCKASYLKNL